MNLKIALAGNPNTGKTTLFNALTGSNQYVGNWPGVTVEKKEGKLKKNSEIILTDLPGIYSLSPYTLEEVVARNYLTNERPDAILNIVDGTNIERNLYLTTQLIELGIPVVVAINMMDIVRKNGDNIDTQKLSAELNCKVVEISALKGDSVDEAVDLAIAAATEDTPLVQHIFSGPLEHAIAHIEEAAVHNMPDEQQRWYAVKIFERDERVLSYLKLSEETVAHIEKDIKSVEARFDDDAESIITNERYLYIENIVKKCCKKKNPGRLTTSDKIDSVLTNRILALPIFAIIMWLVYYLSIGSVGNWTVGFMNDGLFGSFKEAVAEGTLPAFMESWHSIPELLDMLLLDTNGQPVIWGWLYSLIMEGIVGGAGAVLGFVPQMLVLFLLLSILEDCGYMSRVAFIMDKIFRKFGLSGKSFIPLLVATGCSVPGIMSSRTIEQDRDRKMTIMTTAFIPCGAKMPIVGLIAGALFGGSALVATGAYFIGIAAVIISGIILKKTKAFSGNPAPFVMELPSYHAPLASNIFRTTWDRGWSYVKRAGTVIVAASVIIWALNSISFEGGISYVGDSGKTPLLQYIGKFLAIVFAPLGFDSWQAAVATLMGLLAKEEIVGIFGTLGEMSGYTSTEAYTATLFNDVSGLSFLIFNLLCAPCFAAMGAIRKEMNNWKWTLGAIGYMTFFAYCTSLVVYQFGAWFVGGGSILGTITASLIVIFAVYMLARRNKYQSKLS